MTNRPHRPLPALLLAAALPAALLLAGCSGPGTPGPSDVGGDAPCVVGTWHIDLEDYQNQSQAYLTGLGIPVVGLTMTGDLTVQFTADGLLATQTDVTTTGTITPPGQSIPVNIHALNQHSGDWAWEGDGTPLSISNYALVGPDQSTTELEGVEVPIFDFTDIPEMEIECSGDAMTLGASGAPVVGHFVRE